MQPAHPSKPVVYFVIPCYNEAGSENVLATTAPLFLEKLTTLIAAGTIADASRIQFVDDGSTDATWRTICELSQRDPHYIGLSLSRNRGHQNALLAGLMEAKDRCDVTISMDCDGQDDINAVDEMLVRYQAGDEIVYGVRDDRSTDSFFKRTTAQGFYRLMTTMGIKTVYNHADYRLMSAKALEGLSQFTEVNLFLRGLVPLVGYPASEVTYARKKRVAGTSHYPLRKMMHLAIDGITSLSIKPIHIVSCLGIVFSLLGLAGIIWAIVSVIIGDAVSGWASMICVVSLLGGVQLLSLGVIGEYVGRIYLETKRRPRFIVAAHTDELAERRAGADPSDCVIETTPPTSD